jgi:asparagine synthetase B (glutamine-hydrolysing)
MRLQGIFRGSVALASDSFAWCRLVGALHEPAELRAALGLSSNSTAEDLVLGAYRRWGDDFPAHLLGEYVLALWDPVRRRFLLARDRLGVRPLYFRIVGEELHYGEDIEPLLAEGLELDEETIALAVAGEGWQPDRTLYRGVRRVPPGHVLIRGGQSTELHTAWTFTMGEPLRFSDEREYAEALRALFVEAVDCRLPPPGLGRVKVLGSGGIGSSAIALTAELLRPGEPEASHRTGFVLSGRGGRALFLPSAPNWRELLASLLPGRLLDLSGRFVPHRAPPWLPSELARRYRVGHQIAERRWRAPLPPGVWRRRLVRRLFLSGGASAAFEGDQAEAAREGLRVSYPFFDWRLVDLALRIPEEQFGAVGGNRLVFQRAMEGIMPAALFAREEPALETPKASREELIARLRNGELRKRGFINPEGLAQLPDDAGWLLDLETRLSTDMRAN